MPEKLWAAAVKLAAAYGVWQTARALRLNYDSLKQRVAAAGRRGAPGLQPVPTFVELVPGGLGEGRECLVELENAQGTKLRIQLKGGAIAEVSALSRSLWHGAP
jgi:hypothetical protein